MLEELENRLKELGKVAIAYSGGIDSTFLLYLANKILNKNNVIAIMANGEMIAKKDYDETIVFLKENDFNYREVLYNPLDIKEFKENHKDRCYYCKKKMISRIKKLAKENGFEYILDGRNDDDLKVYRPGNKVAEELGIISPLAELGISKSEIRIQARKLGIKSWDKVSDSCLATRFPYNTILTVDKLKKVDLSESIIKDLGIKRVRVRAHDDIARIEIESKDFKIILDNKDVIDKIKKIGFRFVTLDLDGIRSGSFD